LTDPFACNIIQILTEFSPHSIIAASKSSIVLIHGNILKEIRNISNVSDL